MTKNEIRQKRNRDAYYNTRKRAFRSMKKVAHSKAEQHEMCRVYDIRNKMTLEYELI